MPVHGREELVAKMPGSLDSRLAMMGGRVGGQAASVAGDAAAG